MTPKRLVFILLLNGFFHQLAADVYNIPFRLAGKMMILQGTVNGQTGYFVLDTGVPDLILNSAYFEGKTSAGGFQSINGQSDAGRGLYVQLHLDELSVRGYAAVIDLSPIEERQNIPILGMIGMRTLHAYEMQIDFTLRELTLYTLDRKGNRIHPEPLPIPTETLEFRYKEHLPCFTAWIDGLELRLGLDTGAGPNVLSTQVLPLLRDQLGQLESRTLLGLYGQTSTTAAAQLTNLQLGNLLLPAMETVFTPLDRLNQLSGPDLDGLLGQEFLQHFRTALNFKKKEIYLWDEETLRQGPLATGRN